MKIAEAMIKVALSMEGIHEEGFDNRGKMVEEVQSHDNLPGGGYAWCASTWVAVADYLGIDDIYPSDSASVGFQRDAFRKKGWLSKRPFRGSIGFWQIDRDTWPDHQLGITKILSLGNMLEIKTIEGNTSPDQFGSQDNGGGMYQRTRSVLPARIDFGRVPGDINAQRVNEAINKVRQLRGFKPLTSTRKEQLAKPTTEPPSEAKYWLWLRWELGEGEFSDTNGHFIPRRPKILPRRIPDDWIKAKNRFLAKRKKG